VAAQRKQARFERVKARYDEHLAAGHLTAAEVLLRELLALAPDWAAGWFDLGLIAKLRRDWRSCLEANERALALGDGKPGDPAAWNLGIAATALGDWPTARRAWAAYGIDLPAEEGPIRTELGQVPIRLNPEPRRPGQRPLLIGGVEHGTEVVWADRISPAHAVIRSVPLPDSGHRYGDAVLHDGEPVGTRTEPGGRELPVFDELARLQSGPFGTTTVTVTAPAEADVAALLSALGNADLPADDWTGSLRVLCPACADGSPGGTDGHAPHRHTGPHQTDHRRAHDRETGDWQPDRTIGIAGIPERAITVLDRWAARAPGRLWHRTG
jgi:hypothetical protein